MSKEGGFFHGFSSVTVLLVGVWTCGGLLVAMTIKYTNVIIKGFASAMSLILICICGSMFLGDYLDMIFLIGATVTIIATFNYNDKEAAGAAGQLYPDKKSTPSKPSTANSTESTSIVVVGDTDSKLYPLRSEIMPLKNTDE